MTRPLDIKNTRDARNKIGDLNVVGDPDQWELVCKVSSDEAGFMKSTKRMEVPGGWVYLITTEHRTPEGGEVTACAEAAVFVPAK